MRYHLERQLAARASCIPPTRKELDTIADRLEESYTAAKVAFVDPLEILEGIDIYSISQHVDMRSSPGWPWKRQYQTNGQLFAWNGISADPTRLEMVKSAVRGRLERLKDCTEADDIYLFIKPEPHKLKKKQQKAWRLISGVGLTDVLVERCLYGRLLDRMIATCLRIPAKAGWTPQQGGYRLVQRSFVNPMAIDKSAWDWTVQPSHILVLADFLHRMVVGYTDDWSRQVVNRLDALYDAATFRLQCGCAFDQIGAGIQKSGCLGTLGFNSVWQSACHELALLRTGLEDPGNFFCMGDDTLQEAFATDEDREAYLHELARTGCTVKECELGWPTTFAGHRIQKEDGREASVPAYIAKHLFGLRYMDPDVETETLTSFQYLYALEPDMLRAVQTRQLEIDPSQVRSRRALDRWYRAYE